MDEMYIECLIDAWHDGYFGENKPSEPDMLKQWEEGREQAKFDAKHRHQMIVRPEGYYHSKLGDN